MQGLDPFEPRGPLPIFGEASAGGNGEVHPAQRYLHREGTSFEKVLTVYAGAYTPNESEAPIH